MSYTEYDAIVIGLGAMGSAASYQLAKKGQQILGIDQFVPPHTLGSSHGESRIIRQAIAEGVEYVPLVLRSYELWHEIEQESGRELLSETGILIMASNTALKQNKFLTSTIAAAKRYGIKHSELDTEDISRRFPQFKLQGGEQGYFEDGAGYLRPETCVATQIELAQKHGAEIRTNEKFLNYISDSTGVTVKTDKGEYLAKQLVLTMGPWVKDVMPPHFNEKVQIYRQVLYWFEITRNNSLFKQDRMPVFNWEFNTAHEDFVYGFPSMDDGTTIKIATEQYANATNPDDVDRNVSQSEIDAMYEHYIKPHFPALSSKCVKAEACLYTVAPDWSFIIDRHPDQDNVIIASPCSGHGFKHSAAIGEILADMTMHNPLKVDISAFSFANVIVKAPLTSNLP